jgi:exonuclease SbcC
MQLHRLRLEAIGPFSDPVDIDFDRLSASGIFLLEGPTGAGKSTLIDAIVFALFGDVAARASSSERIASAVAPDGVTPWVELDFSTTHGRFRLRRTPKHARRKRRGTGTTVVPASAKLWRLVSADSTTPGEPVSTRIDEIGAEVVDIVGLSREQFVQTVVLPQGEFATFLRADAEHRRSLLQRLFGTEIYDRTLERLGEQRRLARQQRTAAATAVLGSIRAYGGASGASASDEDELVELATADPDQLLVVIQQQLDELSSRLLAATATTRQQTQAAETARTAFTRAQSRERARRRVLELRSQLSALDADADGLTSDSARLAAAHEAARVVPALVGESEAERRLQAARGALERAIFGLPSPSVPPAEWNHQERAMNDQASTLERWVEVEAGLAARCTEEAALRAELDRVQQRRSQLASTISDLPAQLHDLRHRLSASSAAAATLPVAQDRLNSANNVLRCARELVSVEQRVDDLRRQRDRARRLARKLLRVETEIRARFIDGMAGQLSQQLKHDEPCPVCGSPTHPNPAEPPADDVTRENVEAAAESTVAATARLEQLSQELSALEAAAAELRGVTSTIGVEKAVEGLAAVEAEVAAAEAAEVECVQLIAAVTDAESRLEQARSSQQASDAESAKLAAALESARLGIAADRDAVSVAAAEHPSVSARVQELRRQSSAWRIAVDALAPVAAAERDLEIRSREVVAALDRSPFSSRDEAMSASLTEGARASLAESIEMRKLTRTDCEAELRSPDLASVDVAEHIDLKAMGEELELASEQQKVAHSSEAQLRLRWSESRDRADEVQTALSAQRATDEVTAAVIRIADLAGASSPDNARGMSLPTFVLRERFVDVVASANHRLATMSDGRYQFEHVEDRRGNRKSGLELQVRDTHTAHPRDPATLSGGETFYCSLALALGLADVVTAEAGGIDLGTLFVDEGFGSLDANTLDQVLEVLHTLASGGRAVGIVSHVPELKEQIVERVSVVKNRDGSSRLIVAA